MSIELRPLGVSCNIACQYCYQNMHRDAGNVSRHYDLDKMKAALLAEGQPFHLFGGEPLLMNLEDLEELFRFGYEHFGENGTQTNGALVTGAHLDLFRRYQVRVGLSIDGPGALNDARWAGTLEKTRAATARSEWALVELTRAGLLNGVMIQLNRCNAAPERLPQLLAWFRELDALGVPGARLHILEIEQEAVRRKYALSVEENIQAFEALFDLEEELTNLRFDVPGDLKAMLTLNDEEVPCVWRACDPYYTDAVHGMDGQGERHNCGLTDKEGIHFQKPEEEGFERYLALYHTPQEYGGCQGCRFFLACKGQCPGTAMDHDWRNRSEYCEVWKTLFTRVEGELLAAGKPPLSQHPQRRYWEEQMVEAWARGVNLIMKMDFE